MLKIEEMSTAVFSLWLHSETTSREAEAQRSNPAIGGWEAGLGQAQGQQRQRPRELETPAYGLSLSFGNQWLSLDLDLVSSRPFWV